MLADRKHTQIDTLITILRSPIEGGVTRGHNDLVERIPLLRHTETGTVSLPAIRVACRANEVDMD